ncbi:MAG: response regulator [Gammaproteobacteria bacterium]|nr:response regulator [Gammaproteobacteria bacterium]
MPNRRQERILIVEDERETGKLLKDYLDFQGFEAVHVMDGKAMMRYLAEQKTDLIILDVMLPDEDGLSLARELRRHGNNVPIIMVSALGEDVDRVVGLEVGADDYLPKPVNLRELLARVRAVLRRYNVTPPKAPANISAKIYQFGPFKLNMEAHELHRGDTELLLTSAEFNLLAVLVTHPGQVLSRDRLMNLLKGYDHTPYDRSIDVRISRLRQKLEAEPASIRYIHTIRGEGYLFSPQDKKGKRHGK